jgi:hypothetical protein
MCRLGVVKSEPQAPEMVLVVVLERKGGSCRRSCGKWWAGVCMHCGRASAGRRGPLQKLTLIDIRPREIRIDIDKDCRPW